MKPGWLRKSGTPLNTGICGAPAGPWTTEAFIEASYRERACERWKEDR